MAPDYKAFSSDSKDDHFALSLQFLNHSSQKAGIYPDVALEFATIHKICYYMGLSINY